jgi:hypothetical protein
VVAVVLLTLFFRVSRVRVQDDAVVKRGLFGRTRRIGSGEVARVVLVPCYRRLSAPVTELDGEVKPKQLREDHPYAINWAERHAVALYWMTGIVVVAVVGIAVVGIAVVGIAVVGIALVGAAQGWCRPDGC